MRIALVQQRAGDDRAANLDRALASLRRAAAEGAELVAFAELAVDRFFPCCRRSEGDDPRRRAEPVPGPTTDRVAALARELEVVVVFNLYEIDAQGRTFDSSPVIDADGRLLGVTRMVHVTDFPGFHEQDYYHPGDRGVPVYATRAGRVGVAICYDRHYPEVMRALGAGAAVGANGAEGAELVVIPQAGVAGEWPEGMVEAEVRTAAFQNGYFAALCNRVGREGELEFAGESFVCDPEGRILARGAAGEEDLVLADLDLSLVASSTARRLFWCDRRPDLSRGWPG
jgi:predicted amidohydrolase